MAISKSIDVHLGNYRVSRMKFKRKQNVILSKAIDTDRAKWKMYHKRAQAEKLIHQSQRETIMQIVSN